MQNIDLKELPSGYKERHEAAMFRVSDSAHIMLDIARELGCDKIEFEHDGMKVTIENVDSIKET